MKISYIFVLILHHLILAVLTTSFLTSSLKNISVTVFTEQYFHGVNVTLNFSVCALNLHTHETLGGNISSINSRGNCVNLYKTPNCTDEFIVIKPGSPIHYDLSAWKGGFYKNVNSIGPCFPRCDLRAIKMPGEKVTENVNTNSSSSNLVTLYDDSVYKGAHATINLLPEECHLVPLHLKRRISSVKVHGNFCIELHHTWNCDTSSVSKFTQLRPNSPKHTDLIHWVGHDNQAVAVSLCGFDCNNSTKSKPSLEVNGTQNDVAIDTVTIFDDDEAFFKGHFKNLNFSSHHTKCVNLDGDWDGQLNNLKAYGHCVIIYDEFNCSTTGIGKNLTIPSNTTEIVSSLLKNRNFNRVVQSIKLCNDGSKITKNGTNKKGKQEKYVGTETSAKSIFFIVLFAFVTLSLLSVGVAFLVKRALRSGFGYNFRNRGRGGSHSLMF